VPLPNYQDRHYFSDATPEELGEILDLLPQLSGRKLGVLLTWAEDELAYCPIDYDTGTRWLIWHLKGRE
jgi:hypothetical protein